MKRFYTLLLLLNVGLCSHAQLDQLYANMGTALQEKDAQKVLIIAQEIQKVAPDNYAGPLYKSFGHLMSNNLKDAQKELAIAKAINGCDFSIYAIDGYFHFMQGNEVKALQLFNFSFQFSINSSDLQEIIKDATLLSHTTGINLEGLKAMAKKAAAAQKDGPRLMQLYSESLRDWEQGKPSTYERSFFKLLKTQQPVNEDFIAFAKAKKALLTLYNKRDPIAEELLTTYAQRTTKENQYTRAQAHWYLGNLLKDDLKYELAQARYAQGIKQMEAIPYSTVNLSYILTSYTKVISAQNKYSSLEIVGRQLVRVGEQLNDPLSQAQGYLALGQAATNTITGLDRAKALPYLDKSLTSARLLDVNENLVNAIHSAKSIALFQAGRKEEARALLNTTMSFSINLGEYSYAQLQANNLGFMSLIEKDFPGARDSFQKAVDITERYYSNLHPEMQLLVRNEHSSAYAGLIASLQETGEINRLFKAQDQNRSRLLRTSLDINAIEMSIAKVQASLHEDEAVLYYSLIGVGEVVGTIITNENSFSFKNFPINKWQRIKQLLTNKVKGRPSNLSGFKLGSTQDILNGEIITYTSKEQSFQKEDFEIFIKLSQELLSDATSKNSILRDEVLTFWNDWLIQPAASVLSGKKKLVISGEGVLNYIPFEAFIDQKGKYLIETYDIKYIPSASIWLALQNKALSQNRKSVLAMGGATYQNPTKNNSNVRGLSDIFSVKESISSKIKTGATSLNSELKALGMGGANYLKGTLEEVQKIQRIVPDATVLIDQEMKESDIKELDASGALGDYKILHIATHGFALDGFPELSGIMMTQPDGGDGKEDTFLLAHEIANLNLNADLVVLSACETALGELYNGEGVSGLNAALLTAGTNNTLLSLWPVNDAGTMVFMTILYKNIFENNLKVEDAVNATKRAMITNEQNNFFKNPAIWAPFVLNGK